ncbi:MAG: fasciclin domain-containing protein [Halobacteriota archaeon]
MASDLRKLSSVNTVQGGSLKIEVHRLFHRGIKVDDAQVVHPDIESTNGTIHVIDSVLIPE